MLPLCSITPRANSHNILDSLVLDGLNALLKIVYFNDVFNESITYTMR
jgi:hypothetical protein